MKFPFESITGDYSAKQVAPIFCELIFILHKVNLNIYILTIVIYLLSSKKAFVKLLLIFFRYQANMIDDEYGLLAHLPNKGSMEGSTI